MTCSSAVAAVTGRKVSSPMARSTRATVAPAASAGVEQLRGEVEARRSGRRRTGRRASRVGRVDRLVALRVVEGAVDVGRQGHGPGPLHHRRGRAAGPTCRPRPRPAPSGRPHLDHRWPPAGAGLVEERRGRQPPSRPDQGLPLGGRAVDRLEQQHLGPPAAGLGQVEAGRPAPGCR